MKPTLVFQNERFNMAELGEESSVPNLVGNTIIGKELKDEIHHPEISVGYGRRFCSYPYRQFQAYNRILKERKLPTAVLENKYLKAVFLPTLGGRLWSLIDKEKEENLLYTNDVIRFSNLAICNAWFSGGVEWNISMIGHSPFTTRPLFTAQLENEKKNPVLRMYEYERVRNVVYQMDFWLDEEDRELNCRMRIDNLSSNTIPMYWWSNMAVPEYTEGRIIVAADRAYSSDNVSVYPVSVPMVENRDISSYQTIPRQVDYFFDLDKEITPYIANLNKEGYGLLHTSSFRLHSRKLFCWGNNKASNNWQAFLTEQAGHYVEIQAGLPRTQYACIPMEAHARWEWMEQYGPIRLPQKTAESFFEGREFLNSYLGREGAANFLEKKLEQTKEMADKPGEVLLSASGYALLHAHCVKNDVERVLPSHLDFSSSDSLKEWMDFIETGKLKDMDPNKAPYDFVCESALIEKLKESLGEKNKENWYAWYQAGLGSFYKENLEEALKEFEKADELSHNPWTCHALASCLVRQNKRKEAVKWMSEGMLMRQQDLSYLKEGGRLLIGMKAYEEWDHIYHQLDASKKRDGRLYFYEIIAMANTGRQEEAFRKLNEEKTMFLDDLRECEDSVEELWQQLYRDIYHQTGDVPPYFCYSSM